MEKLYFQFSFQSKVPSQKKRNPSRSQHKIRHSHCLKQKNRKKANYAALIYAWIMELWYSMIKSRWIDANAFYHFLVNY